MRTWILAAITGTIALGSTAAGAQSPEAPVLTGSWSSAPVRLVRGDLDETFRFALVFDDGRSVMDVVYSTTGEPATERTIRQDVTVLLRDGDLQLIGASPRLLAGPALVGTYAPDTLLCQTPKDARADALRCRWGSEAQAEAPAVRLRRQDTTGHAD